MVENVILRGDMLKTGDDSRVVIYFYHEGHEGHEGLEDDRIDVMRDWDDS